MEIYEAGSQTPRESIDLREEQSLMPALYLGSHAQEPKIYVQDGICGPTKRSFIERGKPVYDDHVTLNS